MECIVRKLKATINNPSLPLFENVVLKNYITTTVDGQHIALTDIIVPQSNSILEVTYQTTSIASSITLQIIGQTANTYIQQRSSYCRAFNTSQGANKSVTANTDIVAKMDTHDGSFEINGTTGSCENPLSNNYSSLVYVFGTHNSLSSSLAGIIKVKRVKITNKTTNVVYTLVPAELNGVAYLYDADRGKYYGEANGGTLLCG